MAIPATTGRKAKEQVRAIGFDEQGRYLNTFVATSIRERCGLAGLKAAHLYGGLDGLDVPTLTFSGLSVTVEANYPQQLQNLFSAFNSLETYMTEAKVNAKGEITEEAKEKERTVNSALLKMKIDGASIPKQYAQLVCKVSSALTLPNVQSRRKMLRAPTSNTIDQWVSDGCPDVTTVTTETKAKYKSTKTDGGLGYVLESFSSAPILPSNEMVGFGSMDLNTDTPVQCSFNSLFLSSFSSTCMFVGHVCPIPVTASKTKKDKAKQVFVVGYPDINNIDLFITQEFPEYINSVNAQVGDYEVRKAQFAETASDKAQPYLRINPVKTINEFVATNKYFFGEKRNETWYQTPIGLSAINGITVYEFTLGQYEAVYNNSSYVQLSSKAEYLIAILSPIFKKSMWGLDVDSSKRITDPKFTGYVCECSVYSAIVGGDFATNIHTEMNLLCQIFKDSKEFTDPIPELIVLGDNKRKSVASAMYQNFTAIRNIFNEITQNKKGLDMAIPIVNSIDRMLTLSQFLGKRVHEYLLDIANRHGKGSVDDRNRAVVSIYYALNRERLGGVRKFILYTMPRMFGPAAVLGFEDGKIAELISDMNEAEMYQAVIMALRGNSRSAQ